MPVLKPLVKPNFLEKKTHPFSTFGPFCSVDSFSSSTTQGLSLCLWFFNVYRRNLLRISVCQLVNWGALGIAAWVFIYLRYNLEIRFFRDKITWVQVVFFFSIGGDHHLSWMFFVLGWFVRFFFQIRVCLMENCFQWGWRCTGCLENWLEKTSCAVTSWPLLLAVGGWNAIPSCIRILSWKPYEKWIKRFGGIFFMSTGDLWIIKPLYEWYQQMLSMGLFVRNKCCVDFWIINSCFTSFVGLFTALNLQEFKILSESIHLVIFLLATENTRFFHPKNRSVSVPNGHSWLILGGC